MLISALRCDWRCGGERMDLGLLLSTTSRILSQKYFYIMDAVKERGQRTFFSIHFQANMLSNSLHPLARRFLNFWTLARGKNGQKNLGFGFVCFRSRALLDRYAELISGKKIVGEGSNRRRREARRRAVVHLPTSAQYDRWSMGY